MTGKGYAKETATDLFETDEAVRDVGDKKRRAGPSALEADNASGLDESVIGNETGSAADDIGTLKAELAKAREEASADREHLLRVSAEFENYKKRSQRHMEDFKKYANESLLKELLTVVDNLERAVSSSGGIPADSPDACIVEGVEMTLKEIMRLLEKFHVTPIEAMGKPFDPAFHEAVMREETDAYPQNTICNVLQKGYMIHDRLLRPAMVSVACG